jgi:hypothetical protein
MKDPNPQRTRRPKWILSSTNLEKYQDTLKSKVETTEQRIVLETMTKIIQECAKKCIKKTKEETPKQKLKWRTLEINTLRKNGKRRWPKKLNFKKTSSTETSLHINEQMRQRGGPWKTSSRTSSKKSGKILPNYLASKKQLTSKALQRSMVNTTSTIKIANEFADQFARTSSNKNYIKGFRMKKEELEK